MQQIKLYTLNLQNAICPLYLNKARKHQNKANSYRSKIYFYPFSSFLLCWALFLTPGRKFCLINFILKFLFLDSNPWAERTPLKKAKSHFCFQMNKLRLKLTPFLLEAKKKKKKSQQTIVSKYLSESLRGNIWALIWLWNTACKIVFIYSQNVSYS